MRHTSFLKFLTAMLVAAPLAAAAQTMTTDRDAPESGRPFQPSPENMRLADPDVIERLRREDLRNPGLPRYMTAAERRLWQPAQPIDWQLGDLPNYTFLRPQAEYEANQAILMRWGHHNSVLTSMIVPITTGDTLAKVMLVVSGPSQEASATSSLNSAGANLDRVEFVHAASNSVWIRDYGPRFASGDFVRMIVDHEYDRPRPQDNAIPSAFANLLEVDLYELPLFQGGGNYHSFGNGEAFITDTILYYNPGVSEQQVKDYFAAFQGVDLTFLGTLGVNQAGGTGSTWYDGTGHLDMWFMPIDDQTVMIGQYNPSEWNGIPFNVTEQAVQILEGRGYTVLRTPGWRASGIHYTYTNGVIVNDIVFTCTFNGYPTQNAQAQAVYEQAFPDRTVVPIDCSSIIGQAGALHCIVKHKPYSEQYMARPPYYDWSRGR